MGIYNLDKLFTPRAIAMVGRFDCRSCKEQIIYRNLRASRGEHVYLVNLRGCGRDDCPFTAVPGSRCCPYLTALPEEIDLLISSLPLAETPALVDDCRAAGVKNLIITRGKTGTDDDIHERAIVERAREGRVRLLGFNSFGLIVPRQGFNTSFFETEPAAGKIALISQSGAVISSILDLARVRRVGFSHVVSLGSLIDVDFGDMIDFLGWEYDVRCILLYIENLKNVKKFLSACRSVARIKPIVAIKGGKNPLSREIIKKHTGHAAGEDQVYDSALRRAGIIRVETVPELLSAGVSLSTQPVPRGERLGMVTNSGGLGVVAVDELALLGVALPPLSAVLQERLQAYITPYSGGLNPVCIASDADNQRYIDVIRLAISAGEFDTLMVIMVLSGFLDPELIINTIRPAAADGRVNMVYVWLGNRESFIDCAKRLVDAGTSVFFSIEEATNAFAYTMRYYEKLAKVVVVPPRFDRTFTYDRDRADELIRGALAAGREIFTEREAKELLACYRLPVNPTYGVNTFNDASRVAERLGYPVVLKSDRPDAVFHKSDRGGVVLNIRTEGGLYNAWDRLTRSCGGPEVEEAGMILQPMFEDGHYELNLGARTDIEFGPFLFLGMGGPMARVVTDEAVILPPVDRFLARKLINRTPLPGCCELRPFNMERLEEIIVRLSQLVVDFPQVRELRLDPLIVAGDRFAAVDAKVRLREIAVSSPRHLCTTPYPNQYEFHERLRDGREVFIRPIKPEDAEAHYEMIRSFSQQTRYYRFFSFEKGITDDQMVRFTQIDYDREIAIVAKVTDDDGREITIGVNRLVYYPHNDEYEFAIVIRDDWQKTGVGSLLMEKLIRIARDREIHSIYGYVLADNIKMMKFVRKFGFRVASFEEDMMHIRLDIAGDETHAEANPSLDTAAANMSSPGTYPADNTLSTDSSPSAPTVGEKEAREGTPS
ncbi:MAG: bifunctional acetate--CoA ligase family protein/GNAT family N-acetyltransferase [Deltaproteobacteria bacterium]|nr:bifunctional acetate--CoA ligase family protein/GNAT family N-acetyltransferase [Candidatus Anaeroferrophillacea bacterium]